MRKPADVARSLARRLQPHTASIAIMIAAIAIAWTFVFVTLHHVRTFNLPIEDSYIYLTYAKQFGRAQPFSYFPGGGYSAGSTSVLWPMLLAPFWTLGARGHALVWVSFGMCTALYGLTCVGCQLLAKRMFGSLAGVYAGVLALVIAPFAFTALAGMEVAFASALLVSSIILVANTPGEGRPSALTIACLAATSLSRPEAMLIVAGIVAVAAINRLRRGDARAALWWVSPLVAPVLWLTANKLFAGHWFPNTGVAKSHFYLPGFDWSYWWDTVLDQTGKMLKRLFWGDDGPPPAPSPFAWPRIIAVLWLVGAVRIVLWARRAQRPLVAAVILGAPFVLMIAVIASSGAWDFHNYRYIAPGFPLIMLTVACAIAPVTPPDRLATRLPVRHITGAIGVAIVALFVRSAREPLTAEIDLYAQNATDLDTQVVALGHFIHDKLPESSIMFHDAGAIAYYGDRPGYDMLGLVTNDQAGVANNGPGARFEFLESLPPEQRPTHFAYYPSWMGQTDFYGEVIRTTPLARPFAKRRMVGDRDMQLIVANWDHVHTAELPLDRSGGWRVVDRVDIADVASERAHGWQGDLGRRKYNDPTARWSFVHRQTEPMLMIDGGRTIRGGTEQMTVDVDPEKPIKLLLRTGGDAGYSWHEPITQPVAIRLLAADGTALATGTIPPPKGSLVEIAFDVRATEGALTFHTQADGPYRALHWFVLQPE